MPTYDRIAAGRPCWIELATSDAGASRSFYGDLFGWTSDVAEEFGGYVNFSLDGRRIAGCMTVDDGAGPSNTWTIYVASDDAEKTITVAAAEGASVSVPPMPVGALGTMAVMADAAGATVGVWQPGEHTGFGIVGERHAPCHFELHTRDFDRNVAFYESVFGWTTESVSDEPGFRYRLLDLGPGENVGIMDATEMLADGEPSTWSVYFAVDDVDTAVARVTELGGSVVLPREDTPYGVLAMVADRTGATFKLRADS